MLFTEQLRLDLGPTFGTGLLLGHCTLGSGETSWYSQKIWAEPDLVAF